MGKRGEKEQTAIQLYAEGKEIPQISKETKVSENSLRNWKKRAGKEWDEARAAFSKGFTASMEGVGARMIRSRQIAAEITGDAGHQGRMGLALNQAIQTMLYDIIGQMQTTGILDAESMTASIDQVKGLALTLQRTEAAANLNLKREAEIRQKALKDAADQVVVSSVKKGGLTDEAANEIRKKILGIGA